MANLNVQESPYFEAKLAAGAKTSVTYGVVDINNTYTEAQIQALSTAVTNLVAALKARGIIL